MISRSGDALLRIVDDILDLSKTGPELDLESTPLSLPDVILDALGLHAFQAERKGWCSTTPSSRGVPTLVLGDPSRLRQILFSLVATR